MDRRTSVVASRAMASGGYLRDHRLRISLWIAVVEGFLVVINVVPEWAVFIVAAVAVAYWATAGRNYTSSLVRQASWIFAASQVFVLLVPLLFIFFKTVAYVIVALLAIAALVFLFAERERA
jgi:hypothetical protein